MECVAVAPANQLNARVLLAVPLDTRRADNLLEAWIHESTAPPQEDGEAQEQSHAMVARILPPRAAKQNISYINDTSNESDVERVEDDRASYISFDDATEETDTDTSVTSDLSEIQDVPDSHDTLIDTVLPQNSVTPQTAVPQDSDTDHTSISPTGNQSPDDQNPVNTVTTNEEINIGPNTDIPEGVDITPDSS